MDRCLAKVGSLLSDTSLGERWFLKPHVVRHVANLLISRFAGRVHRRALAVN